MHATRCTIASTALLVGYLGNSSTSRVGDSKGDKTKKLEESRAVLQVRPSGTNLVTFFVLCRTFSRSICNNGDHINDPCTCRTCICTAFSKFVEGFNCTLLLFGYHFRIRHLPSPICLTSLDRPGSSVNDIRVGAAQATTRVSAAESTLVRISAITSVGSSCLNTELPATIQFAPADAALSIVPGPRPPSTCVGDRVGMNE